MIIGIGVDIVNTHRIKNAISSFGMRFLDRIFTQDEITYCYKHGDNAHSKFATRFAAKEACMKAFGTGCAHGISFKDIEVIKKFDTPPEIQLHGAAEQFMNNLNSNFKILLSLSDDTDYAVAYVLINSQETHNA